MMVVKTHPVFLFALCAGVSLLFGGLSFVRGGDWMETVLAAAKGFGVSAAGLVASIVVVDIVIRISIWRTGRIDRHHDFMQPKWGVTEDFPPESSSNKQSGICVLGQITAESGKASDVGGK